MSFVDLSRDFMRVLGKADPGKTIGPIDGAALAATIIVFQQEVVDEMYTLGHIGKCERDDMINRLAGQI